MENNLNQQIELQEIKDRYVANKCLNKVFTNKNLLIYPTDISCSVDLKCFVNNRPFNVEIKERYKNGKQLEKYPNAELKVDKLRRMRLETPQGTPLIYMVLLNEEKCLMFNLDKLDWTTVEKRDWWIKRTQLDPNSDYVCTPTYFIPYSAATVTMDCKEFYTQYYN